VKLLSKFPTRHLDPREAIQIQYLLLSLRQRTLFVDLLLSLARWTGPKADLVLPTKTEIARY
jgi:hypothetical protein